MGVINFVINSIVFIEIATAVNVLQSEMKNDKQGKELNFLLSVLDPNKEDLHRTHHVSQSPDVYRIPSSSESEEYDDDFEGPDIITYLVSSPKQHVLRSHLEDIQQNASEISIKAGTGIDYSAIFSKPSLSIDIPVNSTLRKKDKAEKETQKKQIKDKNIDEIKESLRSCTSKSIKSCKKACKAALNDACETFSCKGKFKSSFKKESKKICKDLFNEPKKTKYNSQEEW